MKKLVLAIATVLCLLTTVKAQTFTDEFTGMYLGSIPGIFTTSGHPYMVAVAGIGKLSVLDGDLNLLAEVENDTYIYEAYYMDADATPITISNYHNTSDHGLLLSQNLFNSDDYFEYLETQGSGDWGNATNINIKSSNGSTLYTIDADEGWFFPSSRCAFVLKIENNIYLVLREYPTTGQEDTVKHLFYLIKKNQGLTKVDVDLPISVFPANNVMVSKARVDSLLSS